MSLSQNLRVDEAPTPAQALWDHILVLEEMVSLWPKREYYLELAALYGRAGDTERELKTYTIAYDMGWLDQTAQLVRMAQLLMRDGRLDAADDALRRALDVEAAKAAGTR